MSTIPKEIMDNIETKSIEEWGKHPHKDMDDYCDGFYDGGEYGYQLATDGREELEKENEGLKISLDSTWNLSNEQSNRISELEEGLKGVLRNTHGCRFCDSGVLRTPNNPAKDHDEDCPYLIASKLISDEK